MNLEEMQWPAVAEYLEDNGTILLPIGSTEQHGPHLPLGTDIFQPMSVAEGVADELDVLVAPPLWYGDARHHLAYPGTMALRPETMIHVLRDLYDSLAFHGFDTVVTINGHRTANIPAVENAMKQAKEDHPDITFAVADLIEVAASTHEELRDGEPEDGNHGGEFETSFMLAEHSELVDESEFAPSEEESLPQQTSRDLVARTDILRTASNWQDAQARRENFDHQGHQGDPTKATAEKGTELRTAMIENIVAFIEDVEENTEH